MPTSLKVVLSIILIISARNTSLAEIERLVAWQPDSDDIRYVIPKVRGESLSQFMARWQKTLKSSQVYGPMENIQNVRLSTAPATFSGIPRSTPRTPNVAVVINRPNQLTEKSTYMRTVFSSFQSEGVRLFAIPVGLEEVLSQKDLEVFRKHLNSFDGQLGIGGDDPHPATYGQRDVSNTKGDISFDRDIAQSSYMTEYLRNGKGRVFYICGSMQRCAIADGYSYHDDITHITKTPHQRTDGPVMMEVVANEDSELAKAAGSTRFMTSNYHHSGVDATTPPRNPPQSKIVAYNVEPDGTRGQVVKAIQFPNKAGFATQFHPEFRGSPAENNIIRYVTTGWKMRGRYEPDAVLRCIESEFAMLEKLAGSAP